jgi:hypothetical protein
MPFSKITFGNIEPASLQVTPILYTWTQVTTIYDYTPTAVNSQDDLDSGLVFPPMEAYSNTELGSVSKVGDPHPNPAYTNAYAIRATVEPYSQESSTHLRIITTWVRPNRCSEFSLDSFQQVEVRNYDATHTLAIIPYSLSDLPKDRPFVANLRTIKIVRSISITQWEEINSSGNNLRKLLLADDQAFYNTDSIWGFKPGELLFVGKKVFAEGIPIARVTYQMLFNPNSLGGWHHAFAVFVGANGLVPIGIKPIDPASVSLSKGTVSADGAMAFRIYGGKSFADIFAGIKPFGITK